MASFTIEAPIASALNNRRPRRSVTLRKLIFFTLLVQFFKYYFMKIKSPVSKLGPPSNA